MLYFKSIHYKLHLPYVIHDLEDRMPSKKDRKKRKIIMDEIRVQWLNRGFPDLKSTSLKALEAARDAWTAPISTPQGLLKIDDCVVAYPEAFQRDYKAKKKQFQALLARIKILKSDAYDLVSFDPYAPIDIKLFAQIQNDAFLSGTYKLEGLTFGRTMNYLARPFPGLTEDLSSIFARTAELSSIEERIEEIDKSASKQHLDQLCEEISDQVLALKEGEFISIPGGWGSSTDGHAMTYQFKHVVVDGKPGIELYVYNAGAGIQYHERLSRKDSEKYCPVYGMRGPLPLDKESLQKCIQGLMVLNTPSLRSIEEIEVDEKTVYEWKLANFHFAGFERISVLDKFPHSLTAGQLSGTCTERVLHQMLKSNFPTLNAYKHFIYKFKHHALDDFMQQLRDTVGFSDKRVQTLIQHAIDTLLRTLNTFEDMSPAEVESERRALLQYRAELARTHVVEERSPPIAPPSYHEPGTSMPFQLPTSQRAASQALETVTGGPGLMSQLQTLQAHCDVLLEAGLNEKVARLLESVFLHLPLPESRESFYQPLAFYQDIKPGNQAAFLEHLKALQATYLRASVAEAHEGMPRSELEKFEHIPACCITGIEYYMQAQLGLDGYYARTIASTPSAVDIKRVIKNRNWILIKKEDRIEIGFCSKDNRYVQKEITEESLKAELSRLPVPGKVYDPRLFEHLSNYINKEKVICKPPDESYRSAKMIKRALDQHRREIEDLEDDLKINSETSRSREQGKVINSMTKKVVRMFRPRMESSERPEDLERPTASTESITASMGTFTPPKTTAFELMLTGGPELIPQMNSLLSFCQSLAVKGDYAGIMTRLQRELASLPLPNGKETSKEAIPFYQGITAENQTSFYESLDALQQMYAKSSQSTSGDVILPETVAVGLSIMGVCDYVQSQLPLNKEDRFGFIFRGLIMNLFLTKNERNPYFATLSPILDARLQQLKRLSQFESSIEGAVYHLDYINYYKKIVATEPVLEARLLEAYDKVSAKLNPKFAKQINNMGAEAAYYFTTHQDDLKKDPQYKPLIDKFNTEAALERCLFSAASPIGFRTTIPAESILFNEGNTELTVKSRFCQISFLRLERSLLNHKYLLPPDNPCRVALEWDAPDDTTPKKRSNNQIQLSAFPIFSTLKRMDWFPPAPDEDEVAPAEKKKMTQTDIEQRQLLYLREVKEHQITFTLEYFNQNVSMLSGRDYQVYLEANLFEPGLLLQAIDSNPELFEKFRRLLDKGMAYFSQKEANPETLIYFIHLSYLFNRYATEYKPLLPEANKELKDLQEKIAKLIAIDGQSLPMRQALYQYQCITAMARIKVLDSMLHTTLESSSALSSTFDLERASLLDVVLFSYFQMNATPIDNTNTDTASQVDLARIKYEIKTYVASFDESVVAALLGRHLQALGLGECVGIPTKIGDVYSVRMRQGETETVYSVDAEKGFVLNDLGMVRMGTPALISNHAAIKYLCAKTPEYCMSSPDGCLIEFGEPIPEFRFVRESSDYPFRIQKKWTMNGHTDWYELHDHSKSQKKEMRIDSTQMLLPDTPDRFRARNTLLWTSDSAALVTEKEQPIFLGQITEGHLSLNAVDAAGVSLGLTLCVGKTWLHDVFASFEGAKFISVLKKNDDAYEINFDRYGLSMLANKENGVWVYRLKSDPSLIVEGPMESVVPGMKGFVLSNGKERYAYVPLQPFILKKGASSRTEFRNFQQDISGDAPEVTVKKIAAQRNLVLTPWQRTNSEAIVRFPLEGAIPKADNLCDALSLCYFYLGSQQAEKAWEVLENCTKQFGSFTGSVEELKRLHWIITGLPLMLNLEDTKASLKTPAFVACQLKALSLFTSAFTPGKNTSPPLPVLDERTPEGLYEMHCWEKLSNFHNELNGTLFDLYSRYQTMQRHMPSALQLQDDEKKSLLDYYYFNLPGPPPKAFGAMGYEWHVLQLKMLKKEYEALKAEERAKGKLSSHQQKRLAGIDTFLTNDLQIRAYSTEILLKPLALDIPKECVLKGGEPKIENTETPEKCEAAMKSLSIDMKDKIFLTNFSAYYAILKRDPSDPTRKKLIDFCTHIVMARHHVPLEKQADQTAFIGNILLRIAEHPRTFVDLEQDVIKTALTLPPPKISIYQVRETTEKLVLAGRLDLWKEIAVSSISPMVAAPCVALDAFDVAHVFLASGFGASTQQEQICIDYQAASHRLGAAPETRTSDLKILSPEERLAGEAQYQALQSMKLLASSLFTKPEDRLSFLSGAQAIHDNMEPLIQSQWDVILALANRGPADPLKKQHRDLELDSGAREPLDKDRLLALYFKADKAQYTLETGLTDLEIESLHTSLSRYVAMSVRQQSLQRFQKKMTAAGDTTDPSVLQQAAHDLLTLDEVNYETEPVMALMQYRYNLLLRPQQIAAIKRLLISSGKDGPIYTETIEKIIPGGGKSKILLPELAQLRANGTNLVVVEGPRALFHTYCVDLSHSSQTLYQQKAIPFEFSRHTDCKPESLQWLYEHLQDVIASKNYLVTMGDAVQSLELKYFEILLHRPSDEKAMKEWTEQVAILEKLVLMFQNQADVIIDEVHQGLNLKNQLIYTMGEPHPVDPEIISECVALYEFFEQVSLDALGGVLIGKTFADLQKNNQLITQQRDWDAAFQHLTHDLIFSEKSPLHDLMQPLTPEDKAALMAYFQNKGATGIPPCVQSASPHHQEIFARYKAQVSHFLPDAFTQKYNETYGASLVEGDKGIAIPYDKSKPVEGHKFSHFQESMNFTVQMMLMDGIPPEILKRYLKRLEEEAIEERIENPRFESLDETPAGQFLTAFGCSLNTLRLDNEHEADFNALYKALHRNKKILSDVLKKIVLPQIRVEPETIHSNACNHVSLYRTVNGLTGTPPPNSGTFHQRLSYNIKTSAATDGFLVSLLKGKSSLKTLGPDSLDKLVEGLFAGKTSAECVRCIMDVCATFRGIGNKMVAQALARYLQAHPTQLSAPDPIKYVLFFNEHEVLCALHVQTGAIKLIDSSDPDDIDRALPGSTPFERFTYYDQSHTLGTDVKQAPEAKGLVLVDHKTQLQCFLQGASRLRGLQDKQSVEIIVPPAMAGVDFEGLLQSMVHCETEALQQNSFSATLAKMTNIIREDFKARLFRIPDLETKNRFALAFKPFFVDEASDKFFAEFGAVSQEQPTKEIFQRYSNQLLDKWTKILQSLDESVDEAVHLRHTYDTLIEEALPRCKVSYISDLGPELGTAVAVQTQTKTQAQVKVALQTINEVFDPSAIPSKPVPWEVIIMLDVESIVKRESFVHPTFLSLTDLCTLKDPDLGFEFSNIHCSKNFYRASEQQQTFLGAYLKPVMGMLFRKLETGGLECIVLSQEELANIREVRLPTNTWVTSTQHALLAGKPPEGIKNNLEYQQMIEQLRFFNGELSLLQESSEPLQWLNKDTDKKLAFFEQAIMPYHRADQRDVLRIRQNIAQKEAALQYVAEHPTLDYSTFPWPSLGALLKEGDILDCKHLAEAFSRIDHGTGSGDEILKEATLGFTFIQENTTRLRRYIDKILADRAAFQEESLRLLKAIEDASLGSDDLQSKAYCERLRLQVSNTTMASDREKVLTELSQVHQAVTSENMKEVRLQVTHLERKAKKPLSINCHQKAKKITDAVCKVPLEERGVMLSSQHSVCFNVQLAMAEKRILKRRSVLQEGFIDTKKAAPSYKVALQNLREKSPVDRGENRGQIVLTDKLCARLPQK